MSVKVTGATSLERRLSALSGPQGGEKIMRQLGNRAIREQKLLVARKTGNLGRSIHLGQVTATSVTTEASATYAAFVEYGTRPHDITPKVAKVLAWAPGAAGGAFRRLSGATRKGVGSGSLIFAKRVHHPGTRAEPYMVPGAKLAVEKSGLTDIIVSEWNDAA